ncbi:hypothetical protein [Alicyclobacillus suci]|uniref:hypothetical protein n=1 Tax=Alicyclobacillus suci TaxID=2816080 RepID=UPI001F1FDD03|nr:hypothetical protein [Alicyclobacillus suci]
MTTVSQRPSGQLTVGEVRENWAGDAKLYEYSKAADHLALARLRPSHRQNFPQVFTTRETRELSSLTSLLTYELTTRRLVQHS